MYRATFLSLLFFIILFASSDILACDDKPCESVYLAETKQHISNHIRCAETYGIERHAYSRNRERRDYAVYRPIHMVLFGRTGLLGDSANRKWRL